MQDVFFTNARAKVLDPNLWYQPHLSLVAKLERLIDNSNIFDFISANDIVAVKTHFGDVGTTKTLRSVFIRKIVEKLKERKARVFVTETTGLGLIRKRCTALGRLLIAEENGYTSQTVGAPIIIADGFLGFDFVEVEVDGKHLKKVYVAKAFDEIDAVVCATHFKLHMKAGMGGSIKNVGVGCVAKPSKFDLHCEDYPKINENCNKCGKCVEICPANAIVDFKIDESKCLKCIGCVEVCEENAIDLHWFDGKEISERIVECAKGVYKVVGKENFAFLNFMVDVTPHCDCHPYSDTPIISDVGIFASKDIVAVDKACLDVLTKANLIQDCLLYENKFWEWTDPFAQIEYGEELGLGESEYRIEEFD